MRRTIEVRRDDVMHHTSRECKSRKAFLLCCRAARWERLERVSGIEPQSSAWKSLVFRALAKAILTNRPRPGRIDPKRLIRLVKTAGIDSPCALVTRASPSPSKRKTAAVSLGRSTNGEGWLVYGSNSATAGTSGTLVASGTNENLNLVSGTNGNFRYYFFLFDPATNGVVNGLLNSNVLLDEIDASVIPPQGHYHFSP